MRWRQAHEPRVGGRTHCRDSAERPRTWQRARSQPEFVSSARGEGVVSFHLAGRRVRKFEDLSICSTENFSSDGEGRPLAVIGHPEGTEKSLANAHAPARVALLCRPLCESCGRDTGGHGFRIFLEIRDDQIYEPHGRLASRSFPIRLDALSANRWFRDRVRVAAHLDRRRREA
jgi:hypothetical protein